MSAAVMCSLFTVVGIIVSVFQRPSVRLLLCNCILLSLVIYRFRMRKKSPTQLIYAASVFFIAGILSVSFCDFGFSQLEKQFNGKCIMQGRIIGFSETESYDKTLKYANVRVKRISTGDNDIRINKIFRINVSDVTEKLSYGDILTFGAVPYYYEEPYNFGDFNYKRYMHSRSFAGTCNNPEKIKIRKAGFYPPKIFYLTAEYVKKMIYEYVGGDSADLVCGILIGDRSGFSEKISENIRLSGVSHIAAVSGMHISILVMFILWFTNLFTKRRKTKAYTVIPVLTFYMVMTGLSPSVVRASVMAMSTMAGLILGRRAKSFDILIMLACLMLIINPNLLFNPSFMLSFLATFGLIVFMPLVSKRKAAASPFMQTLLMTVTANAATLPYVLWNFGAYSWIGIFVNIIIVPLISYVFIGGMLTVLLGAVPVIGKLVGLFTRLLASLIISVTGFAAELPIGQSGLSARNVLFIAAYFILIGMLYIMLKNRDKRSILRYFSAAFVLCLICGYAAEYSGLQKFSVSYIYVGHGDCALINLPGGKKLLVDTGDVVNNRSRCAEYLVSAGINHLDSVLISHSDSDHCGALGNVLADIETDRIYVTEYSDKAGMNGKIHKTAEKYGCPVETVRAGSVMKRGGAELEIIYPGKNVNSLSENDSSMVIKLTYGGRSFIFTGDISKNVEDKIADKIGKCDVLKIAHHGSETSASQYFLNTLKPRYAVVSADKESPYKYSDDIIRQKLHKNIIKGYYTYSHGTIKFTVNKRGNIRIKTKRGEYINAEIERQSSADRTA